MAVVRHTRLAKLTRPRLHAPVARARLFRRLDQLRAQPVVWITGPPGAGKTTLVASYLDAARLEGLWYQIDPGDSDPATFFLYLRQAIAAFEPAKSRPLPLLTPEYLPDLPGFARRFFRDALSRLPAQTLLVLDNYHELAPDSALHEALAAALQEIPPEANVIVASRAEPPSAASARPPAALCRATDSARHDTFNFLHSDGQTFFVHFATHLACIERRAPFTKAHLMDEDITGDFGEVITPNDRVADITTVTLADDEVWAIMTPGSSRSFAKGRDWPLTEPGRRTRTRFVYRATVSCLQVFPFERARPWPTGPRNSPN